MAGAVVEDVGQADAIDWHHWSAAMPATRPVAWFPRTRWRGSAGGLGLRCGVDEGACELLVALRCLPEGLGRGYVQPFDLASQTLGVDITVSRERSPDKSVAWQREEFGRVLRGPARPMSSRLPRRRGPPSGVMRCGTLPRRCWFRQD